MTAPHPYIPHTEDEILAMLEAIGVENVEALFSMVPAKLRLGRPLDLPAALSEQEIIAELTALAEQNTHIGNHDWFLGAGTYAHYSPSVVDMLIQRGEFLTAYTPYQAEISQGTLQAIFEWQTMMASLTGVDVANASMYDGASAAAEGVLMAMRITRRSKIALGAGLHPHYREVIQTYVSGLGVEIVDVPIEAGRGRAPETYVDDDTACLLIQQPNFFGCIEDLEQAAAAAHANGAMLVAVVTEALSLALLRSPGELGADIVCGEAQSFGVSPSLGGPHVGFLATRTKRVRQMPGRLVGETVDTRGKRGFVLTLSTREQHIRRERATSNICTNQGLCLLAATIYLSVLGRQGLRKLAELNLAKAEYAKSVVRATAGVELAWESATFNEFVVRVPDTAEAALARALAAGCMGGLDLSSAAPELGPAVLVCTTELTRRDAIDRLIPALAGASS